MCKTELLSPAKDLAIGMAAIDNGADAVYIGAPAFGARKSAANSIEDIAALVKYAHRFYCRVFVTLNTILYDNEMAKAEHLIRQLYKVGVDALIIQDMGILRMDLPPVCLHASTQMHNYDTERILFLDRIGFQRIVLAREFSLEQIRSLRQQVKAELEVFIHGALCVSLSGQCYLSQYMFGRSANRGECAQPCRMKWSVKDQQGKVLLKDKYVLSLKDLNLSSYIDDLIDAGVNSFKIEGRLKEKNYVANITNYYSSLINKHSGVVRVGSGKVVTNYEADPERSFNRGYSDYFAGERKTGLVNMDTPKSMGKLLGAVLEVKGNRFSIDTPEKISNGDGLCYVDRGELKGIRVSSTEGEWIVCNEKARVSPGTLIYRNYDHRFVGQVEKQGAFRKIGIRITCKMLADYFELSVRDEDGVEAFYRPAERFEPANNPSQADRLKQQLMKCGESVFECRGVDFEGEGCLFVPASAMNAARRNLLQLLGEEREKKRLILPATKPEPIVKGPVTADWHYNIVNKEAEEFYRQHGAVKIERGFEKGGAGKERELMKTRYCLLYELGRCRKKNSNADLVFPLFMYNDKQCFRLDFDCVHCFMKVMGGK